jgi:hypothetical protein
MNDERKDLTMHETTRRGVLGRGLLFLTGLAGLGAAAGGRLSFSRSARDSLVLYGRNWRGSTRGRRPGELPLEGDRITVRGDLLERPDGAPVGEFVAAAFNLGGATHPAQSERLELHTFKLADGAIFGTGIAGRLEGTFAILGGTGRYAGAQGVYVARQGHTELGGDGAAEFVFTLRV